jgi:hypothetical protein
MCNSKNIFVLAGPKSLLELPPSHSTEGRIAIVTDAGRDAVDAAALDTQDEQGGFPVSDQKACGREMLAADGEVVWS